MREWILRWLGFQEWQAKVEADIGLCKVQVGDAVRGLQAENQYLRAENTKLLELLEKKQQLSEAQRPRSLRQEVVERTRQAFEEDLKRMAGSKQ